MITQQIPQTVAEYFAGIGLVRMGLERAAWRVVYANDFSEKKYEMYADFFPDAAQHYVVDDIFNLNAREIPTTTLATCSFPCVDLSLAGNMNGIHGNHSSAFWGFVRILEQQAELSPPLILLENVPGWLYSNKGEDFRLTVQSLNQLGYACDVFTLDARHFTPQSRLRVFLVGQKSATPTTMDAVLERPKTLASNQLKKRIFANRDLAWRPLPIPNPPPLKTTGLAEIIEEMDDDDGRWWSDYETQRHLAMMAPSHHSRVMQMAQEQTFSYRTFFRRRRKEGQRAEVRHDDIAGCLRTAVGGSGKQFLVKAGRGIVKLRTMTPREYARLQGVPDVYPIHAQGVQALTGFGDAVCVPAITWIAENVLNPLAETLEPAVSPFLPTR
jgi:DNA (cytosine-5)-methyltransferase 1